jgi:hypothetical protein
MKKCLPSIIHGVLGGWLGSLDGKVWKLINNCKMLQNKLVYKEL